MFHFFSFCHELGLPPVPVFHRAPFSARLFRLEEAPSVAGDAGLGIGRGAGGLVPVL